MTEGGNLVSRPPEHPNGPLMLSALVQWKPGFQARAIPVYFKCAVDTGAHRLHADATTRACALPATFTLPESRSWKPGFQLGCSYAGALAWGCPTGSQAHLPHIQRRPSEPYRSLRRRGPERLGSSPLENLHMRSCKAHTQLDRRWKPGFHAIAMGSPSEALEHLTTYQRPEAPLMPVAGMAGDRPDDPLNPQRLDRRPASRDVKANLVDDSSSLRRMKHGQHP